MKKLIIALTALTSLTTMGDPFLKNKANHWVDSFGEGEELTELCEAGPGYFTDLNYGLLLKDKRNLVFKGGHKLVESEMDKGKSLLTLETDGQRWQYKMPTCSRGQKNILEQVKTSKVSGSSEMQVVMDEDLRVDIQELKLDQATEEVNEDILESISKKCQLQNGKKATLGIEVLKKGTGDIHRQSINGKMILTQELEIQAKCIFKI